MNRFADERRTDPIITLPLGNNGQGILRAADTVIIKARESRFRLVCKRLLVSSGFLMSVVTALSALIVGLILLLFTT